jgi:hypothetical protein
VSINLLETAMVKSISIPWPPFSLFALMHVSLLSSLIDLKYYSHDVKQQLLDQDYVTNDQVHYNTKRENGGHGMGLRIDFLTTLVKEKIVGNAYQLCNLRLVLALRWSCVFIVKCQCALHQRKYPMTLNNNYLIKITLQMIKYIITPDVSMIFNEILITRCISTKYTFHHGRFQ